MWFDVEQWGQLDCLMSMVASPDHKLQHFSNGVSPMDYIQTVSSATLIGIQLSPKQTKVEMEEVLLQFE